MPSFATAGLLAVGRMGTTNLQCEGTTMKRSAGLALIAMLALCGSANAQSDSEWMVAPYFWGPGVSIDTTAEGGGNDISLSDLLDKTDAAGMIRVEYRHRRWGLMLDYIFLALAEQQTLIPEPPPAPNVLPMPTST